MSKVVVALAFLLIYTDLGACKNVPHIEANLGAVAGAKCQDFLLVAGGSDQVFKAIFGIPRKCPQTPLTETFWEIKTCETDADCWPRVCCPDGDKRYCRTSQPLFEKSDNAAARQLAYPIEAVSQYLQCTPAPPVIFDIHPKACNTTLDCFLIYVAKSLEKEIADHPKDHC
ncbi:uncharacterized protein LOC6044476 [Culex quinquefasciatus]|uniref:uncharacterized protein LOC6044476 n=1 Tax=Culex quinquefasciatus TaxID=7176 RepID=UPI0018E2EF3A|nr:uncharacterized protein LOC6044476 [Culex quinquefasciatus]